MKGAFTFNLTWFCQLTICTGTHWTWSHHYTWHILKVPNDCEKEATGVVLLFQCSKIWYSGILIKQLFITHGLYLVFKNLTSRCNNLCMVHNYFKLQPEFYSANFQQFQYVGCITRTISFMPSFYIQWCLHKKINYKCRYRLRNIQWVKESISTSSLLEVYFYTAVMY